MQLGLLVWLALLMVPGAMSRVEAVGFGPPALRDGHYPPLALYPEQVRAVRALASPPSVTAASALMFDLDSMQALFAKEPDRPLPPASTVKVMTALVVLRRSSQDERVTVSEAAASAPGSLVGLTSGETLTVRDLLFGLLLPSGNDAAVALAEHVAGSEEAFVDLMNQTSAELGLTRSHFSNVHGLDSPEQLVTASDMVTITKAALTYPDFAQIVSTASAQVAGRTLSNTNELLSTYPQADGVKTGTTDNAGECLIASVTRDGHRLLVVVLGSKNRYADASALLDYAASTWEWRRLSLPEDALAWEAGNDGRLHRLSSPDPRSVFLARWQWPMAQTVRVLDPTVPFTGTLPVGELRLVLPDRIVASVPLTVLHGP